MWLGSVVKIDWCGVNMYRSQLSLDVLEVVLITDAVTKDIAKCSIYNRGAHETLGHVTVT